MVEPSLRRELHQGAAVGEALESKIIVMSKLEREHVLLVSGQPNEFLSGASRATSKLTDAAFAATSAMSTLTCWSGTS